MVALAGEPVVALVAVRAVVARGVNRPPARLL